MATLGLRPRGFRPPGGRLTGTSATALRELGFTYCSPAEGDVQEIVTLPFAWAMVDAYYYLPRFGPLREREEGAADVLPARRLGAALDAGLRDAVEHGRQVSFVFHPFLTEPADRFAVLREALQSVRALVDDGVVWCGPYRELAG